MATRRIHLFEFEDLPWFPQVLRNGVTDFLRHNMKNGGNYRHAAELLFPALRATDEVNIVDLATGSGGAILEVQDALAKHHGLDVSLTLTDLYPNLPALRELERTSERPLAIVADPVDARDVPETLRGMRTMFSSFHHLRPGDARRVLADVVSKGAAVGIFEGFDRSLASLLKTWFASPVSKFLCCPFIRPFRLSRLVFTYLIPLIPLVSMWDGTVSALRMYEPDELLELTKGLGGAGYRWEAGKRSVGDGVSMIYLIGYPVPVSAGEAA